MLEAAMARLGETSYPDLPFLAFLDFLASFTFKEFLALLDLDNFLERNSLLLVNAVQNPLNRGFRN